MILSCAPMKAVTEKAIVVVLAMMLTIEMSV